MPPKTINFHAYGMSEPITLLLSFKPPMAYATTWVWKTIKLFPDGEGRSNGTIRCNPRLAYGVGQTGHDDTIVPSSVSEVKGEYMVISDNQNEKKISVGFFFRDEDPMFDWDEEGPSFLYKCLNSCGSPTDLYLGLIGEDGQDRQFEPIVLWRNLSSTQSVTFNPQLTLRAYIVKDYDDNGRLPAGIEFKYVWSQKFSELGNETDWKLMKDDVTNRFIVE